MVGIAPALPEPGLVGTPVKSFAVYDLPTFYRLPEAQGATFILWHAGAILEAIAFRGGDIRRVEWETVDIAAYRTSHRL